VRTDALPTKRRAMVVGAVVVLVSALVAACGGDDDAAAEASQALTSAGVDAAAAEGSGLDEPPGLAEREPLEGGFGEVAIAITAPDGEVLGWCVLVADDDELRARGLMEVTDLQGYAGMLFVWNEDSTSQFYMRDTVMPLSIAWFDAAGELVATEDMEPCPDTVADCPLYPDEPPDPYRFALEVPQGDLPSLGIEEGSRLRVGGDCAARST
jgi:uncharacterized membrane protein (UPF0127 family)